MSHLQEMDAYRSSGTLLAPSHPDVVLVRRLGAALVAAAVKGAEASGATATAARLRGLTWEFEVVGDDWQPQASSRPGGKVCCLRFCSAPPRVQHLVRKRERSAPSSCKASQAGLQTPTQQPNAGAKLPASAPGPTNGPLDGPYPTNANTPLRLDPRNAAANLYGMPFHQSFYVLANVRHGFLFRLAGIDVASRCYTCSIHQL